MLQCHRSVSIPFIAESELGVGIYIYREGYEMLEQTKVFDDLRETKEDSILNAEQKVLLSICCTSIATTKLLFEIRDILYAKETNKL